MHRILLVDDDAAIRAALPSALRVEGYDVAAVANGQEALLYLEKQRSAPPSLILLDSMMPVMDGPEFIDSYTANAMLPDVPVVVISAFGRRHYSRCRGREVTQLAKPLQLERLLEMVERLCHRGMISSPAATPAEAAGSEHLILVVDDDAAILETTGEILKEEGYRVLTARNGVEALEALAAGALPSLVLTDLMMPVMTGWELIERMRATKNFASIPIVVTSAAEQRSPPGVQRVLAKPVHPATLLAAVEQLCVADPTRARARDDALRDLAQRNLELAELHRFRDEMSALIVHDMKSPISAIRTNLDFVLGRPSALDDEERAALNDTQEAVDRLLRLTENLLQLVKLESGRFLPQRTRVTVTELLEPLIRRRLPQARERQIDLVASAYPDVALAVDADLIGRVVENILDNAFRYTPPGGTIAVGALASADALVVRIGNTGSPIPASTRGKIFEKFGQTDKEGGRMNLGLGLYFCRLVAEAHGGRIRLEESPDLPTIFALELPR